MCRNEAFACGIINDRLEHSSSIINNTTGEGFIPTQVLREILKELDDKLTDEELDGMVEEIDADGSGTVDFDGMEMAYNIYYTCNNNVWELI